VSSQITPTVNLPAIPIPPNGHESEPRAEQRISFISDKGLLVETIVNQHGHCQFQLETGTTAQAITSNGVRIEPLHNLKTLWETGLVRFPSRAMPYDSTEKLLTEIGQFIGRYAQLPDEWREMISLYILVTWVYDRFTALPYLRFLGDKGTGKTRALETCAALAYNGTTASGNITGAALFRTIDLIRGPWLLTKVTSKTQPNGPTLRKC
jgi:hypothetical protein